MALFPMGKQQILDLLEKVQTVGDKNSYLRKLSQDRMRNEDTGIKLNDTIEMWLQMRATMEKDAACRTYNRVFNSNLRERAKLLRDRKLQLREEIIKQNKILIELKFKNRKNKISAHADHALNELLTSRKWQLMELVANMEKYVTELKEMVEMYQPIYDFMMKCTNALYIRNPLDVVKRYLSLNNILRECKKERFAIMDRKHALTQKGILVKEKFNQQIYEGFDTYYRINNQFNTLVFENERAQAKLDEVKSKVNEAYLKKFDMESIIYNMYVKVMAFKNRRKKRGTSDGSDDEEESANPLEQLDEIQLYFKLLQKIPEDVYRLQANTELNKKFISFHRRSNDSSNTQEHQTMDIFALVRDTNVNQTNSSSELRYGDRNSKAKTNGQEKIDSILEGSNNQTFKSRVYAGTENYIEASEVKHKTHVSKRRNLVRQCKNNKIHRLPDQLLRDASGSGHIIKRHLLPPLSNKQNNTGRLTLNKVAVYQSNRTTAVVKQQETTIL